ncbi:MAG: BatA domain-containing protein [Chloroflexi bacterium]|nr:BatA domain-containing protein [Chloroflexota bacterium]
MSFLTPLALIGAALAIPIILLYMLRLRRREVVVSSTFLWQQVVQDSEANTPWQRLRRNILLFLQLLILAFLVFALARPFIVVPAVSTGQIELLVDASASMNATDMSDGSARFDEAKRQALSIVDTLGAGDTITLIRVSDVPEVVLPASDDRVALRAAINGLQPSQTEADWTAALTLATADAANAQSVSIVLISDGGLGEAAGLPAVPGEIRYVPVGQSDSNLAITALATRALPGGAPQLFAQVTNYGGQDADVIFTLRVDGDLFTARRYMVPARSSLPLVSAALPEGFQIVQAGLTRPNDSTVPDYLAQDNTAWAVAANLGTRRALVMTPGNRFLTQVLRSLPGIEAFQGDINRPLPAEPYDLYLFDSWLPPGDLPDGDILFINPPASTPLFTVGADSTETGNISIRRDDPRLAFVDFGSVNVLKFKRIGGAAWADTLIEADGGPLLLAGEVDGRQVAILTFDLHESDLPLQITWPVLVANLLEWFTPQSAINAPDGLRVGDSLPVRPPFEATSVRVTLPNGTARSLEVGRETLVFADTDQPGIYRVDILNGSTVIQSAPFAVNLFAPGESNIAPQPTITLSGATITPTAREEVGQREFWPLAALLALLVLLVEWVVYHRRLQVRTVFRPTLRRREVTG